MMSVKALNYPPNQSSQTLTQETVKEVLAEPDDPDSVHPAATNTLDQRKKKGKNKSFC